MLVKIVIFVALLLIISIFMSKRQELVCFSKKHIGGFVENKTNRPMQITRYEYRYKLPPGKTSRDVGIFDVDSLVITEPMYLTDQIYFNGVLKFCDYARLEITENEGVTEVRAKNAWICKLLNNFNLYGSVREAFH